MTETRGTPYNPRYDTQTGTYHITYDETDVTSLSTAVEIAVTIVRTEEVTEMEPLSDYFDPDALDRLFPQYHGAASEWDLTFVYEEYTISIHSDGRIIIYPPGSIDP